MKAPKTSQKKEEKMEIIITAMSAALVIIGFALILKETPQGNGPAAEGLISSPLTHSGPQTN